MPMPISVAMPEALRKRIERVARQRTMGVSTAIRALVEERLADLERAEDLHAAREWQEAQAMAAWTKHQADGEAVSWDELEAGLDAALARGESSSPPPSRATRKSRSAGSSSKSTKTGRRG
jgi:hypothetical protein